MIESNWIGIIDLVVIRLNCFWLLSSKQRSWYTCTEQLSFNGGSRWCWGFSTNRCEVLLPGIVIFTCI